MEEKRIECTGRPGESIYTLFTRRNDQALVITHAPMFLRFLDQLFFHKYFAQKHEKEKAKAAKVEKRKGKRDAESDEHSEADEASEKDEEEDEDENSDTEEAEIWKVRCVTSRIQFSGTKLYAGHESIYAQSRWTGR